MVKILIRYRLLVQAYCDVDGMDFVSRSTAFSIASSESPMLARIRTGTPKQRLDSVPVLKNTFVNYWLNPK